MVIQREVSGWVQYDNYHSISDPLRWNLAEQYLNLKKIIWKIKLDGFGDQKSNKKLPYLYKAAWVNKK